MPQTAHQQPSYQFQRIFLETIRGGGSRAVESTRLATDEFNAEDRELVGIGLVSRRRGFVDYFARLQQFRRGVMPCSRIVGNLYLGITSGLPVIQAQSAFMKLIAPVVPSGASLA